MATEDETDCEHGPLRIDCPLCDYSGICGRNAETASCRECRESFSITIADGFTLLKKDGWTVGITLDAPPGANGGRRTRG